MYIDQYDYAPTWLQALIILGGCATFLTLLKKCKGHKYIKHVRILSICVMLFGVIGMAANALRGYYYNNLQSDVLVKQYAPISWIQLTNADYSYYKVNTKHGILKSIDATEYAEQSRIQSERRESTLKEAQQILEAAGYDVLVEYGDPCLVTLNNDIYFSLNDGNDGQTYLKYDVSTASVDNDFSPQFISKGRQRVLRELMEMAAVDAYPGLTNCVQGHESKQIEYGEVLILDGRIIVCMLDNSEPFTANWLLYEYDQSMNELNFLCKTNMSSIADVIFL